MLRLEQFDRFEQLVRVEAAVSSQEEVGLSVRRRPVLVVADRLLAQLRGPLGLLLGLS